MTTGNSNKWKSLCTAFYPFVIIIIPWRRLKEAREKNYSRSSIFLELFKSIFPSSPESNAIMIFCHNCSLASFLCSSFCIEFVFLKRLEKHEQLLQSGFQRKKFKHRFACFFYLENFSLCFFLRFRFVSQTTSNRMLRRMFPLTGRETVKIFFFDLRRICRLLFERISQRNLIKTFQFVYFINSTVMLTSTNEWPLIESAK